MCRGSIFDDAALLPLRRNLFQPCAEFSTTSTLLDTSGTCLIEFELTPTRQTRQSIVNMRVCRTSDLLPEVFRTIRALPSQREWSRRKHDVTGENMMLADDKRPEATLHIGLS